MSLPHFRSHQLEPRCGHKTSISHRDHKQVLEMAEQQLGRNLGLGGLCEGKLILLLPPWAMVLLDLSLQQQLHLALTSGTGLRGEGTHLSKLVSFKKKKQKQ